MKNAILAGAKGIIMFSDPADYCAEGVQVFGGGDLKSPSTIYIVCAPVHGVVL